MPTPTVTVTIDLTNILGEPLGGVVITARMDKNDLYDGIVIAGTAKATTNAGGIATMELFPNALPTDDPPGLGTTGSIYRFAASVPGGRKLDVQAVVPNQDVDLHSIVVSDADEQRPAFTAGSIRWDVAQSLSGAQQQQARDNIGLGEVDDTSDEDKPVSTAQAAADATVLATAQAYADGLVVKLWDDRGSYDASGNTFPAAGGSGAAGAIKTGDIWTISVAGVLGGHAVNAGDTVRALADAPGQIDANWAIAENNIGYVPANSADLASSDPGKGTALLGYDGGTAQDVLDDAKPMQSYTALRAYTGRATGVRITTPGIAGFFYRSLTDVTSADNGGTIIVDGAGRRWLRLFSGLVNVKWFGVVGGGVIDDFAAFQAFLNLGITGFLPVDTYKVTQELVFKHGSRLFCAGNWSGVASTFSTQGVSRILYDGAGGANSCIVRMSDAAVGVDPASAGTRDLQNIGLMNVVLDGNDKAEFGLYCVRAWSNNPLEFITVTRTVKHAFWAGKCWNGSPRNWHAYKNRGAGITLGKDTFGWGNAAVDQSVCTSFFGYFNGCDNSGTPLNVFNDVSDTEKEYGIGVFDTRGVVMHNAQAAQNGGAGIYTSPAMNPIQFHGGFCEGNGRSSGSTASWDIWYQAVLASAHTVFDGMHLGLTPSIKLTGTEPSRLEAGPEFRNMPFLGTIDADWDNYRIVNCDRNAVFSGAPPTWFREARSGAARNLNMAGVCTFDATAGSITTLLKEGVISSVTYVAVGTYDVTLSETFSSARYAIMLQTGDNRVAGHSSVTTNSFRILHRDTAGALTDGNARITVIVTGYYT
jgi:hypothetical protein